MNRALAAVAALLVGVGLWSANSEVGRQIVHGQRVGVQAAAELPAFPVPNEIQNINVAIDPIIKAVSIQNFIGQIGLNPIVGTILSPTRLRTY